MRRVHGRLLVRPPPIADTRSRRPSKTHTGRSRRGIPRLTGMRLARRCAVGLATYRRKRDFGQTAEPRGTTPKSASAQGRSFVVQKHDARRLHYDFRLELDGVLLSWAVPKGPPAHPGHKRLAVRTEDHPLEYTQFEGVIPKGQYGGGSVMIWDRGTWSCDGDPHAALVTGRIDFRLDGERLRGRWTLTRMAREEAGAENWLWIKRSDRGAQAPPSAHGDPDAELSVASGRSMAEIAAGLAPAASSRPLAGSLDDTLAALPHARRSAQPAALAPQLAEISAQSPDGDGWLHELKFDGYRLIAIIDAGEVRLLTRRGHDWTPRFAGVAQSLRRLQVARAIIDGEVVVLDERGVADFQALQNSLDTRSAQPQVYFAFDLPHCEGFDLRKVSLIERKAVLERLVADLPPAGTIRYSEHVVGRGPDFARRACELRLEGIMSKRVDSRYESRRSAAWRKIKCRGRDDFVVGGRTASAGRRTHFGALLLGSYEPDGRLRYVGRVGSGFGRASLEQLDRALQGLEIERPAFDDPPAARGQGVTWLRPERIVEVEFAARTEDGLLRHASFVGLREDLDAGEVRQARVAAPRAAARSNPAGRPRLSNPDRVLYPEQGITKRELADYYRAVADRILPHLVDRPLTLLRCPSGRGAKCFYQRHASASMPPEIRRIEVPGETGTDPYLGIDDLDGLIELVQLGVLELHPWGARRDRLDRPDRLIFDLDPGPGVAWGRVVAAALRLRELLAGFGLVSFARTTGGKGLHVVVPIERRSTWPEAKEFTRDVAAKLMRDDSAHFVIIARKSAREGKIFIDYLRNDLTATAIASWSSRARPGAPVAMPIAWDEVTTALDPAARTVRSVPTTPIGPDPWPEFFDLRQILTTARRRAARR